MSILGLDCSNYGGVPTSEQAGFIRDAGYEYVIVGTQQESIADRQLEAFANVGLHLELYLYPWYDSGDKYRVERAGRLAWRYAITRVWDDIEWNAELQGPEPWHAVIIQGMKRRHDDLRALELDVGIYTGEPYWKRLTGNTVEFNHLPLWHAWYYNDRRIPDFDDFRPYGGWTRPLIWQYHDTNNIGGFGNDRNAAESRFWLPAQQEDDMSAEEREELAERRNAAELASAILDRDSYRVIKMPPNVLGQDVMHVVLPDGSDSNPPIFVAV